MAHNLCQTSLARKLSKEIRFPEIKGKVCRALPYEKEFSKNIDSDSSIFVKGFDKSWTHKTLFDVFEKYGAISSAKVSIDQNHEARGYGFVQFENQEPVEKAIAEVRFCF